jgi:tRNA threonylcarbamoyladenosine biosynthesis protein TsaE
MSAIKCDLVQLKALAEKLACSTQFPHCFCLWGDLGAGKTTFAQYFINFLNNQLSVTSPTFPLHQVYHTSKGEVWHWDLYRLENYQEVWETGFAEIVNNNTCLIEWPERALIMLPKNRTDITFKAISNQEREVLVTGHYDKTFKKNP